MDATHWTDCNAQSVMVRAVHAMLRQSLHGALDGEMSYDSAPSIAVAHTRRVFEVAVATFLGTGRSIMQLPTELFVEVLCYLDIKDQISASHVSRQWRSLSLATPHLWSLITSDDVKTYACGVLARLLGRSRDAPVTLDLVINDKNVLEISLCLFNHLYHVKYLFLQVEEDLVPSLSQPLSLSLETQAPILRSLSLWDPYETILSSRKIHWFGGHAPLLYRLKLSVVPDLRRSHAGLLHTRRLLVNSARRDIPPALPEMTDLFPHLDTLAFTIESTLALIPAVPPETLRRLCNLQRLVITIRRRSISLDSMIPWLSQLTTPHITLSWRRPSGDPSVSEAITAMTYHLLPAGSLSIHYSEGLNLDFRGANGVERTFLEVPHALRPGAAVFAQLRSLSISELAWTQGDVLPPAPALTDLRVFLLRPYSHVARVADTDSGRPGFGDASVFLLRERRALRCPALRRVALVVRCYNGHDPSDEPTVVAPLLVREFLQEQLEYKAPVLDALALVGFQLLQNPVDDVARLFAMARDVDFDPHRPSDLRPASDVLSWEWP